MRVVHRRDAETPAAAHDDRRAIERATKRLPLWAALLAATLAAALVLRGRRTGSSPPERSCPEQWDRAPSDTCFWGQPTSNVGPIEKLDYPVAGTNTGGPDTNVAYYYTSFRLPAARPSRCMASIHMRGFSRSRPTSSRAKCRDIRRRRSTTNRSIPIPGSINPFRPGRTPRFQEPLLHHHDQRPDASRNPSGEHHVRRPARDDGGNAAGGNDHADLPALQTPNWSERRGAAAVANGEPTRRRPDWRRKAAACTALEDESGASSPTARRDARVDLPVPTRTGAGATPG